jgi:hypothetical protein
VAIPDAQSMARLPARGRFSAIANAGFSPTAGCNVECRLPS